MSKLNENSKQHVRYRWMNANYAVEMLLMLPRETWPKFYGGFREYSRRLLEQRGNGKAVLDFDERLSSADEYLTEKQRSGAFSETQANQKRGDGSWWIALETTDDAVFAVAFDNNLPTDNMTLLTGLSKRFWKRLRQCVDINLL